MDPNSPEIVALAARNALVRVYLQVFEYIGQRAAMADRVALSLHRELTIPTLPAPAHAQVRRWLGEVAAEPRRLFNTQADPYIARNLINAMNAAESRAGSMGPHIWVDLVMSIRSGQPGR